MPSANFLLTGLSIILIDLLLAGDNALVIAMAVRALPRPERRIGSLCGAGLAVVLRIALTLVAARLLEFPYLAAAGGVLILWIACKVLADAHDPPDAAPAPRRLLRAIWFIAFADLTMSVDNILAIAGASRGHAGLIIFGLCLSIPFVVFSSNLLADLMDRYPITIYLGVGILGKVAGDMIVEDHFVNRTIHVSDPVRYLVDAALVAAVIFAGKRIAAGRRASAPSELAPETDG